MSKFTGERIRELRESLGMSQAELGEAIGKGKSAVGNYERGIREPNQNVVEALPDIFNVSPSHHTTLIQTPDPRNCIDVSDAGFVITWYFCEKTVKP